MAIVTFEYYSETYLGNQATAEDFPILDATAENIIGAMTRWKVDEETISNLPTLTQTLYKKAICAQIDFFAVNGVDVVATSSNGPGFTVGKVSVSGKSGSDLVRRGAMADYIAPMATMFLEQTGLLNPAVPVAPSEPFLGWWC
jgi:hypothetical protein